MIDIDSERTPTAASDERADDIDRALTAANIATVLRHRRMGIPLLIWRDGKMVEVSALDYPLPTLEPPTEPK